MNERVREELRKVEADPSLAWEILVDRPFITVTIRDVYDWSRVLGVGNACVQLPDKWDREHGIRTAKIRAVKNMLGIPNPHLENIIAHEAHESGPHVEHKEFTVIALPVSA